RRRTLHDGRAIKHYGFDRLRTGGRNFAFGLPRNADFNFLHSIVKRQVKEALARLGSHSNSEAFLGGKGSVGTRCAEPMPAAFMADVQIHTARAAGWHVRERQPLTS